MDDGYMKHCIGCGEKATCWTGHIHVSPRLNDRGKLTAGWCKKTKMMGLRDVVACHPESVPLFNNECMGCCGDWKDIREQWKRLGRVGLRP